MKMKNSVSTSGTSSSKLNKIKATSILRREVLDQLKGGKTEDDFIIIAEKDIF